MLAIAIMCITLYIWPFVNADMFNIDLMSICGIKMTPSGSLFKNINFNAGVAIAMLAYVAMLVQYQQTKTSIGQLLHTTIAGEEQSVIFEHTKPMLQMIKWVVLVPLMFTVPIQTLAMWFGSTLRLLSLKLRRLLIASYLCQCYLTRVSL